MERKTRSSSSGTAARNSTMMKAIRVTVPRTMPPIALAEVQLVLPSEMP